MRNLDGWQACPHNYICITYNYMFLWESQNRACVLWCEHHNIPVMWEKYSLSQSQSHLNMIWRCTEYFLQEERVISKTQMQQHTACSPYLTSLHLIEDYSGRIDVSFTPRWCDSPGLQQPSLSHPHFIPLKMNLLQTEAFSLSVSHTAGRQGLLMDSREEGAVSLRAQWASVKVLQWIYK